MKAHFTVPVRCTHPLFASFLVVAHALASSACGSNSSGKESNNGAAGSGSGASQVAITGTWLLSNVDIDTGRGPGTDGVLGTFSNTEYVGTYSPSGAVFTGVVVEFDNGAAQIVLKVIRDDRYPESTGVYEKCTWELPSADRMIMRAYETTATAAEASASTTVTWGPSDPWVRQ
jgi:hypothetical protein